MREDGKKGKAVYVIHTWKDCLWELGGGGDVPEPRDVESGKVEEEQDTQEIEENVEAGSTPSEGDEAPLGPSGSILTPQGMLSLTLTLSQH